MGGNAIDHAVIQHLRQQHELMLPGQSVRPLQLVLSGGNGRHPRAPPRSTAGTWPAGSPAPCMSTPSAVRDAIHTPLTSMLDGIGEVLRHCPPDLVADLADRGIMMAGGSALIPGLEPMMRQATDMPVHIADRPDICAVMGLGAMLEGKMQPLHLDPMDP